MTNRKKMTDALEGRKPECIPMAIYEWFLWGSEYLTENSEWGRLISKGLGLISSTTTVREIVSNVDVHVTTETVNGRTIEKLTYRTPVGEIYQISSNGWIQEYFLKTPEDYRVMEYIVRNTSIRFQRI